MLMALVAYYYCYYQVIFVYKMRTYTIFKFATDNDNNYQFKIVLLVANIRKQSTAVYRVPRYFFTVNTVDEILRTAHLYRGFGSAHCASGFGFAILCLFTFIM